MWLTSWYAEWKALEDREDMYPWIWTFHWGLSVIGKSLVREWRRPGRADGPETLMDSDAQDNRHLKCQQTQKSLLDNTCSGGKGGYRMKCMFSQHISLTSNKFAMSFHGWHWPILSKFTEVSFWKPEWNSSNEMGKIPGAEADHHWGNLIR